MPSIPVPTMDSRSLQASLMVAKQAIELLAGQSGNDQSNAAVTWQDLVTLGIINQAQVPKK
jgi:hypothetical protein